MEIIFVQFEYTLNKIAMDIWIQVFVFTWFYLSGKQVPRDDIVQSCGRCMSIRYYHTISKNCTILHFFPAIYEGSSCVSLSTFGTLDISLICSERATVFFILARWLSGEEQKWYIL